MRSSGAAEIGFRSNGGKRHDGKAAVGEKRLLADAVLRDVERPAVRPDDRVLFGRRRRRRRHVLELEGDDVHAARERAHGVEVVVRRVDLDVGDLSGRRVVFRARACGRGSRGGAPPSRTCARAGRRRGRRWSTREE